MMINWLCNLVIMQQEFALRKILKEDREFYTLFHWLSKCSKFIDY